MKIALLLIPETNGTVDRQAYLAACIESIKDEGYISLIYDIYKKYISWGYLEYIKNILPLTDVVFVFDDFDTKEEFDSTNNLIQLIKLVDKNKPITKKSLPDAFKYQRLAIEEILLDISEKTKIPVDVLKSKSRRREVVDARFMYYRRAKEITRESFVRIGAEVNRDHSTVTHGYNEAINTKEVIAQYEKYFGKKKIQV